MKQPPRYVIPAARRGRRRQAPGSTAEILVSPSAAVVNGVVHVGSADHSVYAFGLPGGTARVDRAPAVRAKLSRSGSHSMKAY